MLLLLVSILHLALLLRARVSARRLSISILRIVTHGIRSLVMRLAVVLVLRLMSLAVPRASRRPSTSALQINVHTTLVLLCVELQVQLLAYLLHPRLDFLDVIRTVVAFAHDYVKVALTGLLRVANALFQDLLGFFDELTYSQKDNELVGVWKRRGFAREACTVKIDSVALDLADCIVFSEDVFRGLLVVRVGLRCMLLSFQTQIVRCSAIASLVCCLGLARAIVVPILFGPG